MVHDEMAKRRGFRSCRKAGMRNKGHGITSQSHRKTADSRKQHVRAACITRLVLMGGEEEVVRLFLLTAFPVMSSPLTPFPTLLTFMTIITQHLDCCRQNTAITLPSLPSKHRPCQPSQVPGSNSSLPALSHGLTVTATERSPSGVESRIAVSLSLSLLLQRRRLYHYRHPSSNPSTITTTLPACCWSARDRFAFSFSSILFLDTHECSLSPPRSPTTWTFACSSKQIPLPLPLLPCQHNQQWRSLQPLHSNNNNNLLHNFLSDNHANGFRHYQLASSLP